jgi:hypothetical protein
VGGSETIVEVQLPSAWSHQVGTGEPSRAGQGHCKQCWDGLAKQSGEAPVRWRVWSGEALVRWRLIRWQLWTMCHYRSLAPPCWPCPSHMAQVPHWLRAPEVPPSSATLHFLPPSNKIALFREGHLKCMFWAWLPVRHLGLVRFALWSPILLLCVLFCF